MADQSIEKTPMADSSVNKPESGTYGEKEAINQLRADLPPMNREGMASSTGGPAPMPQPSVPMPGRPGGRPTNAPAGVPDVLLSPGGPAPGPAPAPAPVANPQAARLTLLEQLASSPEVSDTTRQWAQMMLETLRG